jgi:hypothetical protein
VRSHLQAKEYELYEAAFRAEKKFKEKFNPYKDIVVKACVKATYIHSKFMDTDVLRCDLPQNLSPLALIQAYINRADFLMKKLANMGKKNFVWETHGL